MQRSAPDARGDLAVVFPCLRHGPLRQDLRRWLAKARKAGLDDESIEALFLTTFRTAAQEDIA